MSALAMYIEMYCSDKTHPPHLKKVPQLLGMILIGSLHCQLLHSCLNYREGYLVLRSCLSWGQPRPLHSNTRQLSQVISTPSSPCIDFSNCFLSHRYWSQGHFRETSCILNSISESASQKSQPGTVLYIDIVSRTIITQWQNGHQFWHQSAWF